MGVYIFPDCRNCGTLEDLTIKAIPGDILKCINEYIKCAEKAGTKLKYKSKTIVSSFLAIQMEPAGDIRTAARRKQIDFNHEAFDDLKSFLLKLFESIDSTVDSS